jgi:hypothetical protein
MAAITNGKMTPISAVKPISRCCGDYRDGRGDQQRGAKGKEIAKNTPVPMPSNTMMRTPAIITAMATSDRLGAP